MVCVKNRKKPVCFGKAKSINALVSMVKCGFRGQSGAINKPGVHTKHSHTHVQAEQITSFTLSMIKCLFTQLWCAQYAYLSAPNKTLYLKVDFKAHYQGVN